jgi:DNA mismatch endonuclease (patch repair protein)
MSKISGKDTKLEILVRKYLFSQGFRYRKNDKILPGTPDIVLPKYKTVIFVHGCFWHGHENCKRAALPNTRREFWEYKIRKNVDRDKKNYSELTTAGWRVIIVWQCEISSQKKQKEKLYQLVEILKNKEL